MSMVRWATSKSGHSTLYIKEKYVGFIYYSTQRHIWRVVYASGVRSLTCQSLEAGKLALEMTYER